MSTDLSGWRTLVTGGAGFIGSHLVDRLLAVGADVTVLDDFSTGESENVAHHIGHHRFRVVECDVRDEPAVIRAMDGVDLAFHLATRSVRRSLRRPSDVHDVNVNGTYTVFKAASQAQVRRLVYCSSSEVNGTAQEMPVTEKAELRPETIYGASKLAGEYYAQVFHRSGWLETVIARPHNAYGPRSHWAGANGEVIPRFILRALAGLPLIVFGSGKQTRDFTYVEETADFLARLGTADDVAGEVFNICRGQEVSILDIVQIINELLGLSTPPIYMDDRPSDVQQLWGDQSRLREQLGISPRIDIRDGLARTLDWFRQHVELSEETLKRLHGTWADVPMEPWMPSANGVHLNGAIPVLGISTVAAKDA